MKEELCKIPEIIQPYDKTISAADNAINGLIHHYRTPKEFMELINFIMQEPGQIRLIIGFDS